MQSSFLMETVFVILSLSYDVGNKSLNINNPKDLIRQTWANQLAYTEWADEIAKGEPAKN